MTDVLCEDRDYKLNRALLQSWRVKKYSYINDARLDYGFLYVTSGRITYSFDGKKIGKKLFLTTFYPLCGIA